MLSTLLLWETQRVTKKGKERKTTASRRRRVQRGHFQVRFSRPRYFCKNAAFWGWVLFVKIAFSLSFAIWNKQISKKVLSLGCRFEFKWRWKCGFDRKKAWSAWGNNACSSILCCFTGEKREEELHFSFFTSWEHGSSSRRQQLFFCLMAIIHVSSEIIQWWWTRDYMRQFAFLLLLLPQTIWQNVDDD